MAKDFTPLTDDELLAVPNGDPLLQKLTPAETQRRRALLAPTGGRGAPPTTPARVGRGAETADVMPTPPARDPAQLLDWLVDSLPTVGGATGGILGAATGIPTLGLGSAPGAVAGASILGAGGEALKELINFVRQKPTPQTSTEAAKTIGSEGALQGLYEVLGQGVTRGMTAAGRGLMNTAIRPSPSLAREFPDVVNTALRERLPVGRILPTSMGGKAGSAQAAEKLTASSQALRKLLAKAEADGVRFNNNAIAEPIVELIDDIAKKPLGDDEMQALDGMIEEFLRRHKGPLTPNVVKDLKQKAQGVARSIYKARDAGGYVPGTATVKAELNEKIAKGAQTSLATIPGVAEREKATQQLIGAASAIASAERRRLPLSAEAASAAAGAVGTVLRSHGYEMAGDLSNDVVRGIVSWLATRTLLSPKVTSRAALTLTQAQVQQMIKEVPRLSDYVVRGVRKSGGRAPTGATGDTLGP